MASAVGCIHFTLNSLASTTLTLTYTAFGSWTGDTTLWSTETNPQQAATKPDMSSKEGRRMIPETI